MSATKKHANQPTLRPMCFIAMPFGRRPPAGEEAPLIDFDRVHDSIDRGARAAGLEPVRADFEPYGGFIHKPMLERLLVAEYVVADLTLANPNVLYEVGVRHGASARATLLICAQEFLGGLPFDVRPLRVLPYELAPDGSLPTNAGKALARALEERLILVRKGNLPPDNPLMQITAWQPSRGVEHSKTDVFLQRLAFTGALGDRIQRALELPEEEAIAELSSIEGEVIGLPTDVEQVHTALLGVFLGYRENKAYDRMVALFERFPEELAQTPVAREQHALALNRLAERAGKESRLSEAETLRRRALASLDAIEPKGVTSETHGIRGRIYKGWHELLAASTKPKDQARAAAALQKAIEAYEEGFRSDIRDSYPGVNAVTLRLLRGDPEDRPALSELLPVVRYSAAVAPSAENMEERYWQAATRLELASASRDWSEAEKELKGLLGIVDARPWMRETTQGNLKRQQRAFEGDAEAQKRLTTIIDALEL